MPLKYGMQVEGLVEGELMDGAQDPKTSEEGEALGGAQDWKVAEEEGQ